MEKKTDLISVLSQESNDTFTVIRSIDGESTLGSVRLLKDGSPIQDGTEVVNLSQIDNQNLYNVTTLFSGKSGPAMVSSKNYRDGYDRIFGKKDATLN